MEMQMDFRISAEITNARGYQRKTWMSKKEMYYRKEKVALLHCIGP